MIRSQIPRFRLPESVIDEEVGLHRRHRRHRDALRPARRQPRRRSSPKATTRCSSAPARRAAATSISPGGARRQRNIHIGIDWLSSVSFGHIEKIGRRVIVLGGGNTAMDCCRTSRRLGGDDVKVIVRSGFEEMKASPWEKEDAMHEGIPILNYLVPKEFTHAERQADRRRLREGRRASIDDKGRRRLEPTGEPDVAFRMRRRPGRDRPGERLPVDRARHRPRVRPLGHAGGRSRDLPVDPAARSFSAAIRPSGRRTSSGRWRMATRRRSRSTGFASGRTSASGRRRT